MSWVSLAAVLLLVSATAFDLETELQQISQKMAAKYNCSISVGFHNHPDHDHGHAIPGKHCTGSTHSYLCTLSMCTFHDNKGVPRYSRGGCWHQRPRVRSESNNLRSLCMGKCHKSAHGDFSIIQCICSSLRLYLPLCSFFCHRPALLECCELIWPLLLHLSVGLLGAQACK